MPKEQVRKGNGKYSVWMLSVMDMGLDINAGLIQRPKTNLKINK